MTNENQTDPTAEKEGLPKGIGTAVEELCKLAGTASEQVSNQDLLKSPNYRRKILEFKDSTKQER